MAAPPIAIQSMAMIKMDSKAEPIAGVRNISIKRLMRPAPGLHLPCITRRCRSRESPVEESRISASVRLRLPIRTVDRWQPSVYFRTLGSGGRVYQNATFARLAGELALAVVGPSVC